MFQISKCHKFTSEYDGYSTKAPG